MSTKPNEALALKVSPDADPITELLHEAERRLSVNNNTPVISRENLEYRVKKFTEFSAGNYAKEAVDYLWSLDPAVISDTKHIPAMLFANAKKMIVFHKEDPGVSSGAGLPESKAKWLDFTFGDAITEAVLDTLYVADSGNAGDMSVSYEEIPYYAAFRYADGSFYKLDDAKVSYVVASDDRGRSYHKINSVQGLSSRNLHRALGHAFVAEMLKGPITLQECCTILQRQIVRMRDKPEVVKDDKGRKYKLFRSTAASPFMTDMGTFLFAKAAGRSIDTFVSATPGDANAVICEIINAIIAKQDPELDRIDKATTNMMKAKAAPNNIMGYFPETSRFPRLHTQLTRQIWETIFRLGRNPSPDQAGPTIEEEFVVALAGKLDISDLESVYRAWQEASVSRWNPFSKKKTKAEIEKEKLGTSPQGKGIEDLYNAQLMIYKLYRAGLVKASSTNEHIAHQGRLMIACAEIWAERLENVLVALEVDMVTSTASPEETIRLIQSLAETVLNPGRDVVREIFDETRLQLAARAEVEEALK